MNLSLKRAEKSLLARIFNSTGVFAVLSLIFLSFLFITSAVEIGLGFKNHSIENSFLELFAWSCLENLKFFFTWLLPSYLIFLPFHIMLPKFTQAVYRIIFILFFVIQLLLIFYFNTTLLMLGNDIFGYSFEEIIQTVGASGSISLIPVLVLVLFLGILLVSLLLIPKSLKIKSPAALALPVISLVFLLIGYSGEASVEDLSSDFERNLIKNKSEYFYTAAFSHFNPEIYEPDIYSESYLGDFINQFVDAEPIEYIDESEYPFLHKELKRDVLTPFFETKEQAPNIVIVMVEGLGRAFTNKGAYLGNFTPFLDSLSTKSLYWPNFLSNGGRTFAVLPSLLGSLPFGENGFMEMQSRMPQQLSLLNLLKNNAYHTSFYYGGNSEFDKMAMYLKKNQVDQIIDEDDFPSGYKKIPASASGFTWGYGDKELFRYYLNTKQETPERPFLDVFLTVSMHNPFIIDETEKYDRIFEEKLSEFGISEQKKENYRNYKKQYTSILFTDDALKDFIQSYKKRDDFENTIFIITGDHRIPEIPMASKIDRYHVPMIIYSPLLKRSAEFESVSSHLDLAPSLIAFLKNNYNIEAPSTNSFVGRGLDTTRIFQNIHQIPLKQTKTALIDFVMGEYHLNGDDLYRLTSELKEELVQDEVKKEELKNAFNLFKSKNAEIIEGKKMLPDTLYKAYIIK